MKNMLLNGGFSQALKVCRSIFFLIILIPTASQSAEQDVKIARWEISQTKNAVWYRTHGELVYGHEFGFVKLRDHCGQDLIMVVLSSSDKTVKKYKGEKVEFGIVAGKERVTIPISYATVEEWNPHLMVMTFTNTEVTEDFINLMSRSPYALVKLTEPDKLTKMMDTEVEKFFLDGFIKARKKARQLCEQSGNDIPADDYKRPKWMK